LRLRDPQVAQLGTADRRVERAGRVVAVRGETEQHPDIALVPKLVLVVRPSWSVVPIVRP
jgi:hypothetical protein